MKGVEHTIQHRNKVNLKSFQVWLRGYSIDCSCPRCRQGAEFGDASVWYNNVDLVVCAHRKLEKSQLLLPGRDITCTRHCITCGNGVDTKDVQW
jgi:hypothetical protein